MDGDFDLTIFGDWGYGPEDDRYGVPDGAEGVHDDST